MAILDPTTNIGKLRLRLGDWMEIEWLPDSVYESTLADTGNNLPKSAIILAQYILAILTRKTDRKLQQLEVYGSQVFQQYFQFLKDTVLNPNQLHDLAPLPYAPQIFDGYTAEAFVTDWRNNYNGGTQSQMMAFTAFPSRNHPDGDPTAPYINNIAQSWVWST
jgi:hypothetical protein